METRELILWWTFAAAVVMFLATPPIIAAVVVRLPTDYFTEKPRIGPTRPQSHPVFRWVAKVGKNLLGVVLVLAGLTMLFTPGQGLLTIVVGLMLVDFPGRTRLLCWIARRPAVWRSMNWLRRRAGKPPLRGD